LRLLFSRWNDAFFPLLSPIHATYSERLMDVIRQHFNGVTGIVERLHALLDTWECGHSFFAGVEPDTIQLLRLAVHEWVANLVQHADFSGEEALITLEITPISGRLRCAIEDNSCGFPFMERIEYQRRTLTPFPERGMGLLVLNAATDIVEYAATGKGSNRLVFTVSSTADSCLDIPFS
jgi:anti-sigma regulatory factor (Ser/Thr protein kinase)